MAKMSEILGESDADGLWLADILDEILGDSEADGLWLAEILAEIEADILADIDAEILALGTLATVTVNHGVVAGS